MGPCALRAFAFVLGALPPGLGQHALARRGDPQRAVVDVAFEPERGA
jgi:hypothetical protein